MSILIAKPGVLATIQDGGRFGHRSLGINPSGAMDRASMKLVNILLGNAEDEAVIEMHFPAPEIVFDDRCSFALGGADFSPRLNGSPISNWKVVTASKEDVLAFAAKGNGHRSYLAVAGGFSVEPWLGSKSTNLAAKAGGFDGRVLKAGDRIHFSEPRIVPSRILGPSMRPAFRDDLTVRVLRGAEFELLTALSEDSFFRSEFRITTRSDRMGFRLEGTPIAMLPHDELISSAVTRGTIQLLPDGNLLILMADHQTTGGYPRVANVIDADLDLVAQLGPGGRIRFAPIEVDKAEDILVKNQGELSWLKMGIRLAK